MLTPETQRKAINQAGFTLVELLLALAIASVLFTSMFWGLDQIVRSRNELNNRATPYTIGPAILDRISRDVANVYWYDFENNNTFFGQNAQLLGREADAVSFVTLSKAIAPEQELEGSNPDIPGRYSWANEVAYVCRAVPKTGFFELWRREDFFVDDAPHSDGEYVMMYDKINSITIKYIGRTPRTAEGEEPPPDDPEDEEALLRDNWDPVVEQGIPRAMLIVLDIAAPDERWDRLEEGEAPRSYIFQRYVPLPQVHMSESSQSQIAGWDGKYNEATTVTASNPNAANRQTGAGAGGRNVRSNNDRTRSQGGRGQNRGASSGGNPFLQALQGAGSRGRGGGGGRGGGLGAIFGGR